MCAKSETDNKKQIFLFENDLYKIIQINFE